jgi:hypothetical protein
MRIPQLIFRASKNGYNIHTMYDKLHEYRDSYHNVVILVQTAAFDENDIERVFGVYLDEVPTIRENTH